MSKSLAERNEAINRLLYDMFVLAGALRWLQNWKAPPKDQNWQEEQIPLNAALVKFRSLHDFFSSKVRGNDITADQILKCAPCCPSTKELNFREAINKWCAHMTWDRVHHFGNLKPPKRGEARQFGKPLLEHAKNFVEKCLRNGSKLNAAGKKHWILFNDLFPKKGAPKVN